MLKAVSRGAGACSSCYCHEIHLEGVLLMGSTTNDLTILYDLNPLPREIQRFAKDVDPAQGLSTPGNQLKALFSTYVPGSGPYSPDMTAHIDGRIDKKRGGYYNLRNENLEHFLVNKQKANPIPVPLGDLVQDVSIFLRVPAMLDLIEMGFRLPTPNEVRRKFGTTNSWFYYLHETARDSGGRYDEGVFPNYFDGVGMSAHTLTDATGVVPNENGQIVFTLNTGDTMTLGNVMVDAPVKGLPGSSKDPLTLVERYNTLIQAGQVFTTIRNDKSMSNGDLKELLSNNRKPRGVSGSRSLYDSLFHAPANFGAEIEYDEYGEDVVDSGYVWARWAFLADDPRPNIFRQSVGRVLGKPEIRLLRRYADIADAWETFTKKLDRLT